VTDASGHQPELMFFPIDPQWRDVHSPKHSCSGGGDSPMEPMWHIIGADGHEYFVGVNMQIYERRDLPLAPAQLEKLLCSLRHDIRKRSRSIQGECPRLSTRLHFRRRREQDTFQPAGASLRVRNLTLHGGSSPMGSQASSLMPCLFHPCGLAPEGGAPASTDVACIAAWHG
jgi:hypothetical protein